MNRTITETLYDWRNYWRLSSMDLGNDHEKFYPSLISEKALLSEFGLSVLATADALDFNLFMNEAEYQEYIRPWFRVVNDDVVCYSEGVKEWNEKQDYN